VRHKADLASLICRTRSDQTVVLKHKSSVELGLEDKAREKIGAYNRDWIELAAARISGRRV